MVGHLSMLRHMLGMMTLLNCFWNQIPNVSFFYVVVLSSTCVIITVFIPHPPPPNVFIHITSVSPWDVDLQGRTPLAIAAGAGKSSTCRILKKYMEEESKRQVNIHINLILVPPQYLFELFMRAHIYHCNYNLLR